jgi:hypothetical protein
VAEDGYVVDSAKEKEEKEVEEKNKSKRKEEIKKVTLSLCLIN